MSNIEEQRIIIKEERKICDFCGKEIRGNNKFAISINNLDFCNSEHKRLYEQDRERIALADQIAGNCVYCDKPLKHKEAYKFKDKGVLKVACNTSHSRWYLYGLHIGDGKLTPNQGPVTIVTKSKVEQELEELRIEIAKLKENR